VGSIDARRHQRSRIPSKDSLPKGQKIMTAGNVAAVANHLWQSTVFAGIAMLLALGFRKQRAAIRYWIWMAASLKFLIPFAVLVDIGSRLPLNTAAPAYRPALTLAVQEIGRPFVTKSIAP